MPDLQPEFELSELYLDLFYKQFIVYLGIAVFPPIALVAFVGDVLSYATQKYRLLRICKRPAMDHTSMKRLVAMCLLFTAVAAILAFP